jgi:GNAT superfamily N-acetyltransferase
MSSFFWHEEPIGKMHERAEFDCGNEPLNLYFRRYARQNHVKGGAKTFLAVEDETSRILGFYSLSPASLVYDSVPELLTRGLARHDVPVYRLGRLAVDRSAQKKGLGGQLLLAAGRRCLLVASQAGGVGLLIDAKDAMSAEWYASYGAVALSDAPLSLLMPLATIHLALTEAGHL